MRPNFLVLAFIAGATALCQVAPAMAQAVRIGVIAPLTGPFAAFGHEALVGVESSARQVLSRTWQKLEIEASDYGCDASKSADLAKSLYYERKVIALIVINCGSDRPPAVEALPPGSLAVLLVGYGGPRLSADDRPYVYRFWGRVDTLGQIAADLASPPDRPGSVAVLPAVTPLGTAFASAARGKILERKLRMAYDFDPTTTAQDQQSGLRLALQSKPDFIIASTPSLGDFYRGLGGTAAELRGKNLIIAPTSLHWTPEEFSVFYRRSLKLDAQVGVIGLRGLHTYEQTGPLQAELEKQGLRSSGGALYAYAAIEVIAAALKQSPLLDASKIAALIGEIRAETILGPVAFTKQGDPAVRQYGIHDASGRLVAISDGTRYALPPQEPKGGAVPPPPPPRPQSAKPAESPPGSKAKPAIASVYNLSIEPLQQREPLVVHANHRTEIALGIGRPWPNNVLPPKEIDERIQKLAGNKKVPMEVRMVCGVCERNATQFRTIEFDPATRESTIARFTIVPTRSRAPAGAPAPISFTLHLAGHELNYIEVDVFVDAVNPKYLADYSKPRIFFEPLPGNPGARPDLVISVTPDGVSGKIAIALKPQLPELKDKLGQLVRDTAGDTWRKFPLDFTVGRRNELESRAADAYKRFRQMMVQSGDLRSKLRQGYESQGAPTFVLSFPSDELRLLEAHRDQALLVFKEIGKDLYRALFTELYGASPDLVEALKLVEKFELPDRPLKVSVETPYFLPWQLLYPNYADAGDNVVDANKFWGFRYDLVVRQLVRNQKDRLDLSSRVARSENVLFARGKSLRPNDQVAVFADDLIQTLGEPFAGATATRVPTVDSDESFVTSLTRNADILQFVFLFSHATGGGHVLFASDTTVTLTDDIGPRIIFSAKEWVTPRRIERIYDTVLRLPVWGRQPIFVLNGCETGTGGVEAANSGLLVSTLIRLGANAVVATESEVWTEFARAWAKTLIAELRSGHDMARAVRNARRLHLEQGRNPMGLLYSLYGSPSARIAFVAK